EATHAKVPGPGQLPWVPVATYIDWSLPCPSIFLDAEAGKAAGVRRPLVGKTMERLRKGVRRYVLEHADPFIVSVNHGAVGVAYLAQHNGGYNATLGRHPAEPATALTTTGSQQNVVTASLITLRNGCTGRDLREGAPAITAGA